MNTEQTLENLIAKAKECDLFYKELTKPDKCEFLSCENPASLYLERFHVCISHGFRLIQCLTEKPLNDNVEHNEANDMDDCPDKKG